MMNRKEYMEKVYSKYWISAVTKYGFPESERKYCDLVQEKVSCGRMLDVAVGTGYPFGGYFLSRGYDVYGIDIAEDVIRECNKKYPKLRALVGDAENLKFRDNYFDFVYCFRSTWYLKDIFKALEEMIRVTKSGGYIILDIMNADSRKIKFEQLKAKTIFRFARVILNIIEVLEGKKIIWTLNCPVTPTSASCLENYLMKNSIDHQVASSDDFLFTRNNHKALTKSKLIYIIRKS